MLPEIDGEDKENEDRQLKIIGTTFRLLTILLFGAENLIK